MPLYLDSNAHVPMGEKAIKAFVNFNNSSASHGHPLSSSGIGQEAAWAIEGARTKIAELIGASNKNQIFFTNGCTQACEWGLGIFADIPSETKNSVSRFTTSQMEHPAVAQAIKKVAVDSKVMSNLVLKLDVSEDAIIDYENSDAYKTICIYVQNEIGTIQNLHKIKTKYLFSDMSQALGKLPVNISELPVDVAVFGGHKFGGPSGSGFMYIKNTEHWRGFGTGSRYYMDIPGTPNVAGIVSMAAALEEAVETLEKRRAKMLEFRELLEMGLEEMGFEIIGKNAQRVPNTTFAKVPEDKFPSHGGFLLMTELSRKNIYIGMGSACGALHTGGSPLMTALGRPSDGQDYVRISQWGTYGADEAKEVLFTIKGILK